MHPSEAPSQIGPTTHRVFFLGTDYRGYYYNPCLRTASIRGVTSQVIVMVDVSVVVIVIGLDCLRVDARALSSFRSLTHDVESWAHTSEPPSLRNHTEVSKVRVPALGLCTIEG